LQARFYISPEIFALECERILLRNWFFIARTDELALPCDYRTFETVGGPVLLTRDEGGKLHAFANTCRHRGYILLEGCGNRRSVVCPYHAWTYRLDGRLRAAPGMRAVPGFTLEAYGLLPVRMAVWEGFIFLNFDDEAPDLATYLGEYPELLASHRFSDMICTWRDDINVACNWKLLLENAMESYHTGSVHAATVGAQTSMTFRGRGEWHAIQVQSRTSIATLDTSDVPPFPPISGLSQQALQGAFFTVIEPMTQFACAQDSMWWLAVRPVAVDRTVLSLGGCFPSSTVALSDFAARAQPYYDRWRQVAHEDFEILEKQQHSREAATRPALSQVPPRSTVDARRRGARHERLDSRAPARRAIGLRSSVPEWTPRP
jgi:phenylpropionate dioxygenase-like ring-hydroxylating dioxygenase large terminal subunit